METNENKKPKLISNSESRKEGDINQKQGVEIDSTYAVKKNETTDENKIHSDQERPSHEHPHEYKTPVGTEEPKVEKLNGEPETNDEIAAVEQDSDDSTQDSSNGETHKH